MSRQYDAKQEALKAYPSDRDAGIDLFLAYLNVTEKDFRYEEGMSSEEYIYGDRRSERTKGDTGGKG
jgi:hypothetical protein